MAAHARRARRQHDFVDVLLAEPEGFLADIFDRGAVGEQADLVEILEDGEDDGEEEQGEVEQAGEVQFEHRTHVHEVDVAAELDDVRPGDPRHVVGEVPCLLAMRRTAGLDSCLRAPTQRSTKACARR